MIKYINAILLIIMMISCKQNEAYLPPLNKPKFFNEHKSGFEKDSFFQINIVESQNFNVFDTTLEYYLSISKTYSYNNRREFIIYRKTNSNSICIGIIDKLPIRNFEINDLESVNFKSEIWGTVESQLNKKYIENYISFAYNLKSCILDFDGWKSWEDGGYSMKLKRGTEYFIWSNDYISNDCKIQIQKLWESLDNDKMIIGLKKVRLKNAKFII